MKHLMIQSLTRMRDAKRPFVLLYPYSIPLYRKLPKRGFKNFPFKKVYAIVNVSDLNKFEDGAVVDTALLLENKIIRKELDGLKILGKGELTKKLTVKAAVFSATAKEKIEAAGGKTEEV